MRTLELHAHAKQVQRSSGRSSVAAAAYRSASQLEDERTGLIHDYTHKGGVEFTRIYAPNNAPTWARDRGALWNAVEAKENRKNSCTAHELEVSFPHEFNALQRREAGDAIARDLMRRYGVAVDIAYHTPTAQADERNYHAHIMFTTRALDPSTKDGWSKTKFRDLSKDAVKDERGQIVRDDNDKVVTRGRLEIASLREFTAQQMNRIAERDGLNVHTEHLSFESRGIDREATQHLGSIANDMERNGMKSRIGDENRERQERNTKRAELAQDAAKLSRALAAEEARQEERININLAAVQNRRFADLQEISIRHHRQKSLLDEDIEKRNGARRREYEAEQSRLQQQLQATGLRKLMRDMLGKTQRDQDQLEAHRKTLENMNMREAEQRGALEARNKAERQEYLDRRNQWEAANLQRLEAERTAALQAVRETRQADQAKTPANDQQPPEWQRQASTEQDNHGNGWAAFKEATISKETDSEINGLFDRAAQKQDDLRKGWAAFKEAREISRKDQTEASKTQSRGRGRGMDIS